MGTYYFHDENVVKKRAYDETEEIFTNSVSGGVGLGFEHSFDRLILSFQIGLKVYRDEIQTARTNFVTQKEWVTKLKEGGGVSIGFML
jgi:hypothetical protein